MIVRPGNHWESFTWHLSRAVFNDYLSFPDVSGLILVATLSLCFSAVGAESGSESLTWDAFQRGIMVADWLFQYPRPAPGSLMVIHLDHPS